VPQLKISLLILTRNRAAPLLRCLKSIEKQSLKAHEVIVLDDASDQLRVSDVLREAGVCDVRVLRSDTPLGIAGGRNRLLREASGDVCFVVDDDAYLDEPNCLAHLFQILERRPKTAIVATRIVDHRFAEPTLLVPFAKHQRRKSPRLVEEPQLVSYFLGGGHAIRREVVAKIGGYHEDFVFGEEELELSYRAIQSGHEIFYAPDVVVHHYPMQSVLRSNARPQSELFYHVRNRLFLAKQFLPAAYVAPYLAIWLSRYALAGLRDGAFLDFLRGLTNGLRTLDEHARAPLSGRALAYLRQHHGRLWF
jgi:GT2 family glycosyltransferase